jgi:hypothetical protein
MQKISFYLLPNRIKVTTDVAGFNTELRQVYQRKIKLYKGIDNTIEFEVRNSDNRKDNVVGYEVVAKFFDNDRKNVFTVTGTALAGKPGLMAITVPADTIAMLDPQLLSMAVFLRNDTEERMLYSDADFNLALTVELANGYNDVEEFVEELVVFNWEFDRKRFVSEIGNFGTRINDDYSTAPQRVMSVELGPNSDYEDIVEVYATNDKSTDPMGRWVRLEDWDTRIDATKVYEGDYRFVRFMHGGPGPGYGAFFNITVVNGVYELVSVINRGQNYRPGDTVTIKGSRLGGDDGVNDLNITVGAINEYPLGSINTTSLTWNGTATGDGYYRNVQASITNSASSIDKIIIRN